MRTIKFRGKCCHSDAWAYGNLVDYGEDECPEIQGFDVYHEGNDVWQEPTVERDTIGQFTGLHDKNGKEIYEGDIIEHPYVDPIFRDLVETKEGDGVTSEVVFHDGAFVVKYDENDFIYLDAFTRTGCVVVIGNIHNNS